MLTSPNKQSPELISLKGLSLEDKQKVVHMALKLLRRCRENTAKRNAQSIPQAPLR